MSRCIGDRTVVSQWTSGYLNTTKFVLLVRPPLCVVMSPPPFRVECVPREKGETYAFAYMGV